MLTLVALATVGRAQSGQTSGDDTKAEAVATFAPLPYPVFALAAGVAHLGYPEFFVASLAERGARFFGMGLLIYFSGPALQGFLGDYLRWTSLALSAFLVLAYVLVSILTEPLREEKQRQAKMTSCGDEVVPLLGEG